MGSCCAGESQVLSEVLVRAKSDAAFPAPFARRPGIDSSLSDTELSLADYANRLPRDAADVADYSPGVARRSNYWGVNTPTFQLRGFNAGDGSAYYKDGFRYQGRAPVSLANVDSIEILRGPQSALYGWLEPGGAVRMNTRQPTGETVRSIALQTDSWGRHSVTTDLGGAITDDTAYRLIASHERGGSFRDGQDGEQTFLAPSIAWNFGGGRKLRAALEILDDRRTTDYGIPAVDGRPAEVPVSRNYGESWGRQHSQSLRLGMQWSQPAWEGNLSVAWSYYTLKYLEYRDVEPYSVTGNTISRWYESYPERYRWMTTYIDWSRTLGSGPVQHVFSSRLEFSREQRSLYGGELDEYPAINAANPVYGQAWTPTAGFSRYDQAWTNHSIGLVLQDEWRIGSLTALAGLRLGYLRQSFDYADYLPVPYEEHQRQEDIAVTPRIGVNWRLTPKLAVYGNLATGSMPVLPQNRGFGGGSFAPVQGSQWESGIKMHSPGNWQASLAIFDIRRRNVLTSDPDHPGYSIQTGEQRSRGIELQWQGKLAPGWQLTAQSTWLDTSIDKDNRYEAGNRLPYAPTRNSSAWLTRLLPADDGGQWSLSGGFVHQGRRFANFANSVELPAYVRFDLGATYRRNDWAATLALENATDRRYYSSGVENRPAVIYPGAPRTLSLRISHEFR